MQYRNMQKYVIAYYGIAFYSVSWII